MRDRLIHHYFDIDLDILWATITEDLPRLVGALGSSAGVEAAPPEEGEEPSGG
ncbi:DUF86 domain-containing protein [Euzebya sp.]|uniref:HepT-like ribonuclease domain-containing protein n=1 Tax=Euzebya sp. TaxID=1971409 RepID=UPI003517E01E